ncbi:MAG TPA: SPOR domain-containing protein [Rhizobacter sp.]|jgi:DedD protein|nr:SPOR domain-containing protein [Rhizobacter sp.]
MGLLSFFKRNKSTDAAKAPPVIPESADSVQQARTRARQRLVGAVVLVGAGVIGFPLLFETQPRPLPVDTPIEIARKDAAPSVPAGRTTPAPRPAAPVPPSVITETPADAGHEVAAASAPAATAPVVVEPKPAKPEVAAAPKPAPPKPEAKPEAKPTESARAQALLEGKEAADKPATSADGRYIVQVGAFAEVTAAREARQKVEKLGLKTYTQVVETPGGKRIRVRVGPFGSRGEADKAADKIKSAGLSSAVYTL